MSQSLASSFYMSQQEAQSTRRGYKSLYSFCDKEYNLDVLRNKNLNQFTPVSNPEAYKLSDEIVKDAVEWFFCPFYMDLLDSEDPATVGLAFLEQELQSELLSTPSMSIRDCPAFSNCYDRGIAIGDALQNQYKPMRGCEISSLVQEKHHYIPQKAVLASSPEKTSKMGMLKSVAGEVVGAAGDFFSMGTSSSSLSEAGLSPSSSQKGGLSHGATSPSSSTPFLGKTIRWLQAGKKVVMRVTSSNVRQLTNEKLSDKVLWVGKHFHGELHFLRMLQTYYHTGLIDPADFIAFRSRTLAASPCRYHVSLSARGGYTAQGAQQVYTEAHKHLATHGLEIPGITQRLYENHLSRECVARFFHEFDIQNLWKAQRVLQREIFSGCFNPLNQHGCDYVLDNGLLNIAAYGINLFSDRHKNHNITRLLTVNKSHFSSEFLDVSRGNGKNTGPVAAFTRVPNFLNARHFWQLLDKYDLNYIVSVNGADKVIRYGKNDFTEDFLNTVSRFGPSKAMDIFYSNELNTGKPMHIVKDPAPQTALTNQELTDYIRLKGGFVLLSPKAGTFVSQEGFIVGDVGSDASNSLEEDQSCNFSGNSACTTSPTGSDRAYGFDYQFQSLGANKKYLEDLINPKKS